MCVERWWGAPLFQCVLLSVLRFKSLLQTTFIFMLGVFHLFCPLPRGPHSRPRTFMISSAYELFQTSMLFNFRVPCATKWFIVKIKILDVSVFLLLADTAVLCDAVTVQLENELHVVHVHFLERFENLSTDFVAMTLFWKECFRLAGYLLFNPTKGLSWRSTAQQSTRCSAQPFTREEYHRVCAPVFICV